MLVSCCWAARVRTVPMLLSHRRFAPSPNNMTSEEVLKGTRCAAQREHNKCH